MIVTLLAFGVAQLLLIIFVVIELRHPPRKPKLGVMMIAAGGLLAAANIIWVMTNGPAGESSIPMRGGILGSWLSLVTAAEVVAFGGFMLARSRRP